MYKLYTDKSEDFKCKIGVEGTNLNETFARLVIESKGVNLMFEGKIDADGNCVVPIKKLKNLIPEGDSGKMKLEVIAEDTFFSPWEDDYTVDVSKKVTVEMVQEKEPIKENKIKVNVITPTKRTVKKTITEKKKVNSKVNHGKALSETLTTKGVTLSNIDKNKIKISKIIKEYCKSNNIKYENTLLEDIIQHLNF